MSSAERSRSSNIMAPCHNHRQQITSSRSPHESVVGSEELNPNMRTSATPPTRRKWANLNGVAVHQLNQFVMTALTSNLVLAHRRYFSAGHFKVCYPIRMTHFCYLLTQPLSVKIRVSHNDQTFG